MWKPAFYLMALRVEREVDRIHAMSEAELRAELSAEGLDFDVEVARTRAILESAIDSAGEDNTEERGDG